MERWRLRHRDVGDDGDGLARARRAGARDGDAGDVAGKGAGGDRAGDNEVARHRGDEVARGRLQADGATELVDGGPRHGRVGRRQRADAGSTTEDGLKAEGLRRRVADERALRDLDGELGHDLVEHRERHIRVRRARALGDDARKVTDGGACADDAGDATAVEEREVRRIAVGEEPRERAPSAVYNRRRVGGVAREWHRCGGASNIDGLVDTDGDAGYVHEGEEGHGLDSVLQSGARGVGCAAEGARTNGDLNVSGQGGQRAGLNDELGSAGGSEGLDRVCGGVEHSARRGRGTAAGVVLARPQVLCGATRGLSRRGERERLLRVQQGDAGVCVVDGAVRTGDRDLGDLVANCGGLE
eukprot:PhM_4_TR1246/c1_g1_i1/m.28357